MVTFSEEEEDVGRWSKNRDLDDMFSFVNVRIEA